MKGIVIVASTRTGTNWLRALLSACAKGQNLGEILRPDDRHAGNFFSWFEGVHGAIPAHRAQTWVADVLSGYIDYAEANHPVPIFDLKYSSFCAFEPTWRSPLDLPVFLQVLRDRGYRIIHLRRESLLATSISEAVAARTGVYTADTDPAHPSQLNLNVADVVRLALAYREDRNFVARLLAGSGRVTELSYETLVTAQKDGTLPDVLRDLIAGTDLTFEGLGGVAIKRLLPDWRAIVSNWQDLEIAAHQAGIAGAEVA